jgi:uncharacterized membrane protein
MAFCSNCGASLESGNNFCTSCGAAAASTASASSPSSIPVVSAAGTGISSNVAGLLCYVFGLITGIIFLVIEPYKRDPFVRFHAFQSIFFNLATIVFFIVWNIVQIMLSTLTHGILSIILLPIDMLLGLGVFVYWLVLLIKAYNNQQYKIPVIGDLAEKQANAIP